MTSLTEWLLQAFADHWPGGFPDDASDPGGPLYLENREDSTVFEVDPTTDPSGLTEVRKSNDWDLDVGNVLGVALTDFTETPAGLGGTEYRSEPILSVRIEAAPAIQHGHVDDGDDFWTNIVEPARETMQIIDNGTLVAAPIDGIYIAEPDNDNPNLDARKDFYQWTLEVQPQGYRSV